MLPAALGASPAQAEAAAPPPACGSALGQIRSAIACVNEGHARSDDEIREYMNGDLCRRAAYPHIVDAVDQAKAQMSAPATPASPAFQLEA